jgi:hypothetical protein
MSISDESKHAPFDVSDDFDLSFKIFHELMEKRLSEILLVSSPYDAFILEEDGRLAERLVHEYRGLNLTRPPRLTWVSTPGDALDLLSKKKIDLVIIMPRLEDVDSFFLSREIKKKFHDLPVVYLAYDVNPFDFDGKRPVKHPVDRCYVWKGNTDLLLAIIKNIEDQMNAAYDTKRAKVGVILIVEDSPEYLSSVLPFLYKEIVRQTQMLMEESINEEHRILRMRARPKILVAQSFEEAESLYRQYKPYLLSIFSDVRFMRNKKIDDCAGLILLNKVKKDAPYIPLLMVSSEEANRSKATDIPAVFLNKNSSLFQEEIRNFLRKYIGFGDFIFRLESGKEIARASNLREMEKMIPDIPDASIFFHATRNHFSTWLMARSEIQLASKLRVVNASAFSNIEDIKHYLVNIIKKKRSGQQKGVVADFVPEDFDQDADFVKIGKGSMGGKARGLAFMSAMLGECNEFVEKFPGIELMVPKTMVVSTETFDEFTSKNNLKGLADANMNDADIKRMFLDSVFPEQLTGDLERFLEKAPYPLAVRSSSLLEDSRYQPYAGIYNTYMIPNNHPDISVRSGQLIRAIKLVYASTYLKKPRIFAKNILHQTEEEKMAVILQQVIGTQHGDYFYPSVSGVVQSFNFYPLSYMRPEEGIAHISFGLGKTVVEGGRSLRFSPHHPQFLPQFSTVDQILKNCQRRFFALKMTDSPDDFGSPGKSGKLGDGVTSNSTLAYLDMDDVANHFSSTGLFSTYIAEDHRIRDSFDAGGTPILTFAGLLKYNTFPLPELLVHLLTSGRKLMGFPIEIEFAVNFSTENNSENKNIKQKVALLQIRPMVVKKQNMDVTIDQKDIDNAVCFSKNAMGNGIFLDIADIVYVKPDTFSPLNTVEIAAQICKINKKLVGTKSRYLLIGPGRWGSADRFLGIPVCWNDISGIGAIIETFSENIQSDPSQGTHFFNNITSLGISYITITQNNDDFINEKWLHLLPAKTQMSYVKHVKLDHPVTLKVDGRESSAVILN